MREAGVCVGGEEFGAALGGVLRLAGGGSAVEERGSDVAFEALELLDDRGVADAEGAGCFCDRGVGHGDGEAAEPFGSCPSGERAVQVVGRHRVGGRLPAAVRGIGRLAWTRRRRTLRWLAVALDEGVDVWLGEGFQELGAAGGGGHRRGGGSAVDQGAVPMSCSSRPIWVTRVLMLAPMWLVAVVRLRCCMASRNRRRRCQPCSWPLTAARRSLG